MVEVDLDEGLGYIETDWGSSFPRSISGRNVSLRRKERKP